jgi:two-component system, OmpR family, heavy metal sensor histidine kinase CusS
MMPVSIRMRLTLSYCLLLTVTLGLLATGLFLVLERNLYAATDEELRDRLEGVQRLMERVIPRLSGEDLNDEFHEHSGLTPGGDMLEVWDQGGQVVFESPSIRDYDITMPPQHVSASYNNLIVRNRPLRILSSTVTVRGSSYTVLLATPVGAVRDVVARFGWLLLWSLPAVLFLAALGGYWMSRRALAPVDEITRTAHSISARNLSQRLKTPNTGDELQRLSETLNDMMARIQAAFQKITQFTADASHELRTPIALIRTTAELSLRKQRDDADYRAALTDILGEAERTSSLIESLMLLARADSEAEGLRLSPTDLTPILIDVSEQCRRLSEAKNIQWTADVEGRECMVCGNAQALRRLFLIVIDNAVKYTHPGGHVSIRLSWMGNAPTVVIADTGIGIAPEDVPLIFERFYRADKARTRDIGGAGLGLSIARWIADAHRITIDVESAPERGSTFRLSFP